MLSSASGCDGRSSRNAAPTGGSLTATQASEDWENLPAECWENSSEQRVRRSLARGKSRLPNLTASRIVNGAGVATMGQPTWRGAVTLSSSFVADSFRSQFARACNNESYAATPRPGPLPQAIRSGRLTSDVQENPVQQPSDLLEVPSPAGAPGPPFRMRRGREVRSVNMPCAAAHSPSSVIPTPERPP